MLAVISDLIIEFKSWEYRLSYEAVSSGRREYLTESAAKNIGRQTQLVFDWMKVLKKLSNLEMVKFYDVFY